MLKNRILYIALFLLVCCKQHKQDKAAPIKEKPLLVVKNYVLKGSYKPASIYKKKKAPKNSIAISSVSPEINFLNDSVVKIFPDFKISFFKDSIFKYKIFNDTLFLKGENVNLNLKIKIEDQFNSFKYLTLYYDNIYLEKIMYAQPK